MALRNPSEELNLAARQNAMNQRTATRHATEQDGAEQYATSSRTIPVSYYDADRNANTGTGYTFPSDPPTNMTLVRASTVPDGNWGGSNPYPHNVHPRYYDTPPSSNFPSEHFQSSSSKEIEELKLLIALRKELANVPAPPGNRYGKLTASGNARVLRGNMFRGKNKEARVLARRHTYDDATAEGHAAVIDGELDGEDADAFFNRTMDETLYEGDPAEDLDDETPDVHDGPPSVHGR